MFVYDKLWTVMKQKNITAYMLREKYGIDSRTIRRLKNNENVTVETLDKICEILDCDIGDIMERFPNS